MQASVYHFGEFRLNPASRELWRGDENLTISRKAFDCLVFLIENRDRAITRDELIQAVWRHVHLTDNALDQAIFLARRTLGDTAEEQRHIKTIRGVGYHWVAPVEIVQAPVAVGRVLGRRMLLTWLPLALLAGVLIAGAVYFLRDADDPGEAVAVPLVEGEIALLLPVAVEEGDSHPWVRLGAMDLIASRLRAAGQPMVPSDTVIALLSDPEVEPGSDEIDRLAAATGARMLLAARAEASGDSWRVSLRSLSGAQSIPTVFGEAGDVLEAARIAADRMALSLGLAPAPEPEAEPGLATFLQQAEAALLAQRVDVVSELIESADSELRQDPRVRWWEARILLHNRDLDAAQSAFESLLEAPLYQQNPVLRAKALHGLAAVHFRRGDNRVVAGILEDATRLLEQAPRGEAIATLGRIQVIKGIVVASNGDAQTAREQFARARPALESTGDVLGLARLENNLGVLAAIQDDYGGALHHFERSADIRAATHDIGGELRARANMVETRLARLEPRTALALEPRLSELIAQTTNPEIRAHGTLAKAALFAAVGRSEAAAELLAEVLQVIEARDDLPEVWRWGQLLHAEQLLRDGEHAQAADTSAELVERILSDHSALLDEDLGRAWLLLIRARAAQGDVAAVAEISAAMRDWAERGTSRPAQIYGALAEAEIAVAQGRTGDAESAFTRALALADAGRVPRRILRVAERYVSWLLDRAPRVPANQERALVVADRIARYAGQDYRAALLQLRAYHAIGLPSAWRVALERTRSLAGERHIPSDLLTPPPAELAANR